MTSIQSLSDKHTINATSDNEALQTDHYMFNNVYIDAALNFSGRLLHEGFVQCCSIKKVKLFPKGPIRKSVQIFIYTTVLGWIILFFYLSFIQNQNAVYISLSNTSGNCENVSKPLTGTFLVSTDGIWESSRGFLYSKATYNYQFVDLLVTNDQFQTLILNQFSLTNIIKIMNKSDIGTNLLIWMQYKKQISVNNKLQSFHFPSSPNIVFNRQEIKGIIYNSKINQLCSSNYMSFDSFTSMLTYTIISSNDDLGSSCVNTLAPFTALSSSSSSSTSTATYSSIFPALKDLGTTKILKVSLASLTSASAINEGLLTLDDFEIISTSKVNTYIGNHEVIFNVSLVFNPRIVESDVLLCAKKVNIIPNKSYNKNNKYDNNYNNDNDNNNESELKCVVMMEPYLVATFLSHADGNCSSCSDNSSKALISCSTFNITPTFILFPYEFLKYSPSSPSTSPSFRNKNDNYQQQIIPPDLAKIINLMFNYNIDDVKSIISQFFMYGSNSNDDIDSSSNQTLLQSSFCEDCVIFQSSHYDTNGYITPYKRSYQPDALSNNNNDNDNDNDGSSSSSSSNSHGLHCADTLSISTESMELLAQNPPQGLFESYYSCKNTWLTNLYYAVGIAFSNMQVFSVLLFIIILPICYSCTIYFGMTKKNELIERKLNKKQKSVFLISSKSSSSSNSSSRRGYSYRGIVDDVLNQYPHRKSSFQDMNPGLRHGINLTAKRPDDDDEDNDEHDGDGNGNGGSDDDDENGNNNDDDDNDKGYDIEFDFDDTNNNNHVMNI